MSMAWGTRRCRLCGAGVLAVAHIPHVPTYATLQGVVRPIFGRHQPWRLRWGAGVRRAHPQVPARPFPRAGLGPPGGCIPPLPRGCMPTPPSARAHPPECPSWPQLPSPTLGPTPSLDPPPTNQGNTIREFSFLENPRAAALKASTASTALIAGAGAAVELKRLVASYAETKVLPHRVTASTTHCYSLCNYGDQGAAAVSQCKGTTRHA